MENNNEIFDSLIIPKSSFLYCVQPQGVGTSAIECLTGYISRLAKEHCVTTGMLFSNVLFPYTDKLYTNNIIINGGNGFFDSAHMINGLSCAAAEYVSMMNDLTKNKYMEQLTLIRFGDILSSRSLLRNKKAWCPACFQEMYGAEDVVYEPLMWMMKTVNVCLRHQILLLTECAKCSKSSLVLERRSNPGYCSHCSSWLGQNINMNEDSIDDWDLVKAKMSEELLFSTKHFQRIGISHSLQKLVNIFSNSNITDFAKKIGVPKTTFWGWYHGKNTPTLEDVIRICNKFGIGIVDFYANKLNFTYEPYLIARRKGKVNKILTENSLLVVGTMMRKMLLDRGMERISVIATADKLKCNKKTLYKHFGKLCKMQAKRYKFYLQENRIKRINSLNNEIRNALVTIGKLDIEPTKKMIEHVLNRPAIFKESSIRNSFYSIQQRYKRK